MNNKNTVYLIDGSAYIYRAYHAISPLTNSRGLPTHAVYGFISILRRVLREKEPVYLAMVFDAKGPTFRNEIYAEYKAHRPSMPEDLQCQIPYIKQVAEANNFLCLEKQNFEADDLIASSATTLSRAGHHVVIVSGDKDLLQLVDDRITMWEPMRDVLMDSAAIQKKYNVPPEKLNDLFALIGDTSDNIPGVPGVGPKTAEKLINEHESLDNLINHLDSLKKSKLKERLIEFQDNALLARKLIRLKDDIPVPTDIEAYRLPEPDQERLQDIYKELEFTSLIKSTQQPTRIETKPFKLIQHEKDLQELIKILKQASQLVIDTETTSLDPLAADLVGLSLCINNREAWYIPLGHKSEEGELCPGQLDSAMVLSALKPLLTDPKLPKIGHNLKYDYEVLVKHGIQLQGAMLDTIIASYLLDPSRHSHKLDDLAIIHLNMEMTSFSQVTEKDKRPDAFAYVPLDAAKDYSCEDVIASLLLWELFHPQLEDLGLWELFTNMETALIPILAAMETTGIKVNPDILADLSREFAHELDSLQKTIYSLAGEEFNINSPKQLGVILFEKLNLPHGRKTKTGHSTDVKVLEKLSAYHDLPATILAHRSLNKLKTTYVDKLTAQINPQTGRIHTSFNQTVTATGRLSSSNPNLQNIPIRTAEGQRIRQAFIADQGQLFLAADYSQIDLRVLAHYSQDKALLHAFREGKDVHSITAAEIFRVNSSLITPQMRRVAKTINFGIVYGMSAFGLSSQLNLSRKESQTFIDRYFTLYAGVKEFMEDIVKQAKKDGYVTTLLNRRRMLPDINSSNKTKREFAERTAINTPIQGTAADIIKLATLRADTLLHNAGLQAKLLLQIHDELVFEVPEEEIEKTKTLVKEAMESVMTLDVPLRVNISTGHNLASVK